MRSYVQFSISKYKEDILSQFLFFSFLFYFSFLFFYQKRIIVIDHLTQNKLKTFHDFSNKILNRFYFNDLLSITFRLLLLVNENETYFVLLIRMNHSVILKQEHSSKLETFCSFFYIAIEMTEENVFRIRNAIIMLPLQRKVILGMSSLIIYRHLYWKSWLPFMIRFTLLAPIIGSLGLKIQGPGRVWDVFLGRVSLM